MSKSIDIPDEIYARLEQQANARGLTVPQLIAQLEKEVVQVRLAAAIEHLRANGILLAPAEPVQTPASVKPIQVQDKPLSEVILASGRLTASP